jgi:hypothetical protein
MIHELAGIKKSDTIVVFVCPTCKTPPQEAFGAQNKDQLVYLWICEKCGGRVLAEWLTIEDKDNDLRVFAKHVKIVA